MAVDLVWSERALNEYEKLIEYLFREWNEDIALRVVLEIDQTVLRIQNTPEHFPIYINAKKSGGAWYRHKLLYSLGFKKVG